MSATEHKLLQGFCGLFLLLSSIQVAMAQQSTVASLVSSDGSRHTRSSIATGLDTELPPMSPQMILAALIETESRVREALNQHTFKRDVTLETIGSNGEVTGQYIRNSQFLFDDQGNRIERVLYHPASTIRQLKITREDIQDLAGAQLLGIDITEKAKYQLNYAGTEKFGSRDVFAFDVTPLQKPDPHRMRERFFVGRVWADAHNFQIVKVKGIVEPGGKQRFPVFETLREPTGADLRLPTSTYANDILHFPEFDVHYRITVRYYDYKRFASTLTITEINEPLANTHSREAAQLEPPSIALP
jgi:hypothetical protein